MTTQTRAVPLGPGRRRRDPDGAARRRSRGRRRDLGHGRLPVLRRAHRRRRRARPRLRGRVPARWSVPFVLPALFSSTRGGYDAVFLAAMVVALAVSSVLILLSLEALRASDRRGSAVRRRFPRGRRAARSLRPDPIRPLCRHAHRRSGLRDSPPAQVSGAAAARGRNRDEDLSRGAPAAARHANLAARGPGRRATRARTEPRSGRCDLPPVCSPGTGRRGPQRLAAGGAAAADREPGVGCAPGTSPHVRDAARLGLERGLAEPDGDGRLGCIGR